jgi:hypothetical protein
MASLWFDVFENHPDFKNRGSSPDSPTGHFFLIKRTVTASSHGAVLPKASSTFMDEIVPFVPIFCNGA